MVLHLPFPFLPYKDATSYSTLSQISRYPVLGNFWLHLTLPYLRKPAAFTRATESPKPESLTGSPERVLHSVSAAMIENTPDFLSRSTPLSLRRHCLFANEDDA
jgi:hypothetical protein